MSKTVIIDSPQHFTQVLQSSRIVVTDFYADWCGPCKAIAPMYEQLSQQLSRPGIITFTKVNSDDQKQIAQTYNISSIPTFMVFKAGRETKRIRGANTKELDLVVRQLAQEADNADAGGAASSSSAALSGSGGSWVGAGLPKGYSDVTDEVDLLGLDFLNIDNAAGGPRAVFSGDKPSALNTKGKSVEGSKDYIESDTDEQLMLFIPFQSALKVHSLHITSCPPYSDDEDEAPMRPRALQLYTNRSANLGFDEDVPFVQRIELKDSDWDKETGTAKVELRFVKFQNISSLVVFVVDGDGESEKTRIDRIRLIGESGEKRKMAALEKVGHED
ncbi:putative thioredoxin [Polychaeton citri CBS 116435]|uniref:Thioredoxin n=1 Tax=Polychaeton citri CBS 116435 TaxID=1314669 RepID=A0A9P4QIV1_9PEZI|nr:putative thioredoxin [Polychaeton citri CBS 116435]